MPLRVQQQLTIYNSLQVRARFPIRTEVALIQGIRGTVIQHVLTAAWDLVIENITHNRAQALEPLPAGVHTPGFEFVSNNFAIEIQIMLGEVLTLTDLLSVLASAHDQMQERYGFGLAFLNIFNGKTMVAHGVIKRSSRP